MSLTSGSRVTRYKWTELPMPTDVINRVNHMGRSQGMSSIMYQDNSDDDDDSKDDDDSDYNDDSEDDDDSDYDDDNHFDYDSDNDNDDHDSESTGVNDDAHDSENIDDAHDSESTGVIDGDEVDDKDSESTGVIDDNHDPSNTGTIDDDECTEMVTNEEAEGSLTEEQMFKDAEELGKQQAQDDMMPSRKRVRKQNINPDFVYEALKNSTETNDVMLTQQMSAKKGLKIFGDRGQEAVMKELQQLLYRSFMHPVSAKSLTIEQKKSSLRYLMFLKEKR